MDQLQSRGNIDFQFDAVLGLMKEEIKTKAILTVPTLASFAGCLNNVSNELMDLQNMNGETNRIVQDLLANREDFAWCNRFCQENSFFRNYSIEGVRDIEITNQQQFQDMVHRLQDNIASTQKKIESIQSKLDGVAIFFIILNAGMILENLQWYCNSSSAVADYKSKLEELRTRVGKIENWFGGLQNPKAEEVNHFRNSVLIVMQELAIIEVKLEALRKESLSKGLTHIAVGLSTVALSFVIPVSAPLFYGMSASGGLNALSSALNFKIIGDVDKLLPLINEIRGTCRSCLERAVHNDSLPTF